MPHPHHVHWVLEGGGNITCPVRIRLTAHRVEPRQGAVGISLSFPPFTHTIFPRAYGRPALSLQAIFLHRNTAGQWRDLIPRGKQRFFMLLFPQHPAAT